MIIAIGLVSTMALSVTAFSTFNIVSLTIEERTREQLVSESIVRGETIHGFFDSKIQQVKNLAKNQILQKSINDINRLEDESIFQTIVEEKHQGFSDEIQIFQNSLDNSLGLVNLHILGPDGKIYYSSNKETEEIELSYIHKSVISGKTSVIEFVPSAIIHQGNAVIGVPIFVSEDNTNSEPMGVLIAKLDILEIDQILRNPFRSTGSDASFLVNEERIIILKSDSEDNLQSDILLNTIPMVLCFDEGRNYYGKYLNFNNKQVYGFSYCVSDLNLALLTEIHESDVLDPVLSLQQAFLFIGITIIAGVGIVSFFLSKSISKPILKLKDAADKITDGNFNTRSNIKSGDEIEQLSKSFDIMATKIQDSLEKIKQRDIVIKEQRDLLLEFSENKQKCCVGIIDIVNSTKIAANLSDQDTSNFYGIFINSMASIIDRFGGIVIKNIGDALLFYFPETSKNNKQYFENVIDCGMTMINLHKEINDKMDEKGLSSLCYRISAVYGPILTAQMSTSSVVDIFGSTVNICTKINSLAKPNELIIGEELYNAVKPYDKFIFKLKQISFVNNNVEFKVYSVENNHSNKKEIYPIYTA